MRLVNLVLFIVLWVAAGCGSHGPSPHGHHVAGKRDAAMILALQERIRLSCTGAGGLDENGRIKRFWRDLDEMLHNNTFMLGDWDGVSEPWHRMASIPPERKDDRARARGAWLLAAADADTGKDLGVLAYLQVDLMRCYFPGKSGALLDEAVVMRAFRAFGLGSNAVGAGEAQRMNAKEGWWMWAAFADSCAEAPRSSTALPDDHRAAWSVIRRAILLGLLLHVHFDNRLGQTENVRPDGFPANPTPENVGTFVAAHGNVPEALYQSYRLMGSRPFSLRRPKGGIHNH